MTASPREPALRIGRITKAHGVRGAVRVEPLTDFPERFRPGSRMEVAGRVLTVAAAEPQKGDILVRFVEIADRTEAAGLQGAYITVPLGEARALPEDRYYHFQLVGLTVVDARRDRLLGRVAEVLRNPANDLLRVTGGDREILIPLVRAVIRSIAPSEGRIVVELPEETEA